MKGLTIKDYIAIFGFAVTIGGWIGTYSVLKSDVNSLKDQLKRVNIEVLKSEQEHNKRALEKIESKVDKIYDLLME